MEMMDLEPAWYCARTKPKHEHIAAANVRRNLGLEVFHPRLRVERVTRRGLVRNVESLFPGYVFIRCSIEKALNDIRYSNGVSSLVHFASRIPTVPDSVIEDLQRCFNAEEPISVEERLVPGAEVILADGAFVGMEASILRVLPARKRVEVLLDILGRPTAVEVDRKSLVLERNTVADMAPFLAAA